MTEERTTRALLVVSFGTSVVQAGKKTIDRIEEELGSSFSGFRIYRAWTSRVIIEKLKKRDGIRIPTVQEALGQMLAEGIRELVVQPTHLMDGIENERMKRDVEAYADRFSTLAFGEPLLAGERRETVIKAVTEAVMAEFGDPGGDGALVFMGHGTPHDARTGYAELDAAFKEMGYENVFLATVEEGLSVGAVEKRLKHMGKKRVILAPFMLVAGTHALQDMAGADGNSWKSRFEAAGFSVTCVMKGLGEYPGIRRLYTAHARAAEKRLSRTGTGSMAV